MSLGVAVVLRSAWVQAVANAIDAGAAGGKIKFYDGARPATGGTATNLLGTVTCAATCGTVTDGVLTFGAFTDDENAAAAGNATWARITDSNDNFVCDASVGIAASGADIILNSVAITLGGIIRITSGTLTAGNA